MAHELAEGPPRTRVPEADRPIVRGNRELSTSGTEGYGLDTIWIQISRVALEQSEVTPRASVP